MTDRRPAPGSAWATHCPDACPREWIQSGKLPDGATVHYAAGRDPYANLNDELDMGAPAFGPIPIER